MKKIFFLVSIFLAVSAFAGESKITNPVSPVPAIHGARIVGITPGKPFSFLIPATGDGPLTFSAQNLPAGLKLDPQTGIISGSLAKEGKSVVELAVAGPKGSGKRNLVIVGGKDQLALTPPMGWNSWNVWGLSVSSDKVKAAADAMVKSGLAAHGFQYVNIDDGWEKGQAQDSKWVLGKQKVKGIKVEGRDAHGEIIPNDKFPDMKALADYVHGQGLKLGIYSSPGPWTCGGYQASWQHEKQDAESYAKWGIDYLKYDWCSYSTVVNAKSLEDYEKPYIEMGKNLRATSRDIVFSLCQYGMKDVWAWGASVGGNLWRTTGDINDTWKKLSKIGFKQNKLAPFSGPGHWNDPDMLVVGKVGWGPTLHQTRLTQDEQITHITLWAMLAAPLLIGCDMTALDDFTLALLTNDEVIDIDQDPLGIQATKINKDKKVQIWTRRLWDGTLAVAMFNLTPQEKQIFTTWAAVELHGNQPVRDLWQHKDLGTFKDSFKTKVPSHGAVLLKIGKPTKEDFGG